MPVQQQYKELGKFFLQDSNSCAKLNNKSRLYGQLQINQIKISHQAGVEDLFFHKLKQGVSLHTFISDCELLCRKYNSLGQLLNKMALQERRYSLWDVAKVKSQIVLNCLCRTYLTSIKYMSIFALIEQYSYSVNLFHVNLPDSHSA